MSRNLVVSRNFGVLPISFITMVGWVDFPLTILNISLGMMISSIDSRFINQTESLDYGVAAAVLPRHHIAKRRKWSIHLY